MHAMLPSIDVGDVCSRELACAENRTSIKNVSEKTPYWIITLGTP